MQNKEIGKQGERVFGLADVSAVAKELRPLVEASSVMTFTGPLGAGKTTLIRALLGEMGVDVMVVTSPTFSYLNCYEAKDGLLFYHFDLYRLNSLDDFLAAGFDEYLYAPASKTLIEWPEVATPLLTHDVCHVVIDYEGESPKKRKLSWRFIDKL